MFIYSRRGRQAGARMPNVRVPVWGCGLALLGFQGVTGGKGNANAFKAKRLARFLKIKISLGRNGCHVKFTMPARLVDVVQGAARDRARRRGDWRDASCSGTTGWPQWIP